MIALQYADRKGIGTIPHWPEVFPPEYHDKLSTAAGPDAKIDRIAHFEEKPISRVRNIRPSAGRSARPRPNGAPTSCCSGRGRLSEGNTTADLHPFLRVEGHGASGAGRVPRTPAVAGEGALHLRGAPEPASQSWAHSVWLLDDEIGPSGGDRARECVLKIPLSNLKLEERGAAGQAPAGSRRRLWVGCDNCSCSDAQNMFEAMKFAAMVTAIADHEPGPPQAAKMFRGRATSGGAACIGRSDDLGAIEVGRRADIVLLDLMDPSFPALNSAVRQLVYTEAGRGVRMVIVEGGGVVVIEDGRSTLLDEAETGALRRGECASVQPRLRVRSAQAGGTG